MTNKSKRESYDLERFKWTIFDLTSKQIQNASFIYGYSESGRGKKMHVYWG
jgi:hypothetical protein